jgi:hypothetical protein
MAFLLEANGLELINTPLFDPEQSGQKGFPLQSGLLIKERPPFVNN